MKKIIFLAISVIMFNGLSQEVKLDSSFGENGITYLNINPDKSADLKDFAIDENGNIYILGSQKSDSYYYDMAIFKLKPSGEIDKGFANNGIFIATNDRHTGYDIKIQNGSKVLISGYSLAGGFVLRLNPDGSLDSSFANNGIYLYDGPPSFITSINILSDNSILASINKVHAEPSSLLVKLSENGVFDSDFGNNGKVVLSSSDFVFRIAESILVDDGIISVGSEVTYSSDGRSAYCKVDFEGDFVTSFGDNGKVIVNLSPNDLSMPEPECFCKIIKADNGNHYLRSETISNIGITKINMDGSYDESFASSGTFLNSNELYFRTFDSYPDGRIILPARENQQDNVYRLNTDGSFDNTFNNGQAFAINYKYGNGQLIRTRLSGSNNLFIGGNYHVNNENNTFNILMVKLNLGDTFSTNDIDKENNLVVYPNPFINQLYITDSENVKNIFLYDISGKEIDIKVNKNKISVNENLAKGVYILKVEFEDGTHKTTKLIKE